MLGRTNYVSHVTLMGSKHEIKIECKEGVLSVKVDGEIQLVVRRIVWKFKGYEKIMLIEGIQVEFYWDVLLSWTYNNNNDYIGQGVFIFQVGDYIKGTMWPEMWADVNTSESCCGSNVANGFSLLPYAWTQN
ncbi:hypothetical protein A2U01_0006389 [Trifolium medium]|uniref:Uncharacterized protein n=1 Tax=Trifolium medium TaxID=97028 RepID=A0A392MDG2_9FABA|nr:hypothetical protein [Trifolium medium]